MQNYNIDFTIVNNYKLQVYYCHKFLEGREFSEDYQINDDIIVLTENKEEIKGTLKGFNAEGLTIENKNKNQIYITFNDIADIYY